MDKNMDNQTNDNKTGDHTHSVEKPTDSTGKSAMLGSLPGIANANKMRSKYTAAEACEKHSNCEWVGGYCFARMAP